MPTFRAIGGHVGPYVVNKHVGTGGNGVVYRANDSQGRFVVLKQLNQADSFHAHTERDLTRRIESDCRQQGFEPCVVPVINSITDGGDVFLVMPYMIGGSLADALARHRSLDAAQTRACMRPVLLALRLTHNAGHAHRDVKPANILLGRNPHEAALADYGIAAPLHSSASPGYSTGYASPEQMQNQKPSTAQDVFSAAATIFELLTGYRPFAATTLDEEDQLVIDHAVTPTPLGQLAPNTPARLAKAIDAALSKLPNARPGLRELYEAL